MSSSASMSCDELHDKDEMSSSSSSPTPSTCSITQSQFQSEAFRSAFRTVAGAPLTMQQRLLAMLHNEMPQPFASTGEEPCTTTKTQERNTPSKRTQKDADYLERRRKNNDSARRSREIRRQREMSNRQQVEMLEEENVQLRAQIALLRLEISQLSLVLLTEGTKPLS